MSEKVEKCKCNENCTCEECNCTEDNKCSEECTCGTECHCDDNCTCKECNCNEEEKCTDKCDCKEEKKTKKHKKEHKLEEKIKQLEEQLLLSKADLVNYRKRKDEETTRMLKYSNEDLVKEILPIIDNLERAIKMDDDKLDDNLSKFLEGFKMIYCNLISSLEKYGVKAIDGNNKVFDPTYHQAVLTEKTDKEPNMVLEVLQKGYLLKDKVIRPAMVKVSE